MSATELVVDSFAGGGGASLGMGWGLGRHVDVAINHDPAAIAMHKANHPETRHYTEDVWKVTPRQVTGGLPVGLLWASPDCKHFSRAKGGKPVEKKIRSLAWVVVKWAVEARPRLIILENVREFADWGPLVPQWACRECSWKGTEGQATLARRRRACPRCEGKLYETEAMVPDPSRKGLTYRRWLGRFKTLGYQYDARVLNSADYGAPTHRRRLFVIMRRDGKPIAWPEPSHGDPAKIAAGDDLLGRVTVKPWRTAAECIDFTLPCPSIFERSRPLAEPTMRRIAHGIKRYVIDAENPFVFTVGNGGPSRAGEPRDAARPMGTVLPKNSSAVIVPHVTPLTHQGERAGSSAAEPLPVITGAHRGEQALIASTLIRYNGEKSDGANAHELREPLNTIPTENRFGLIAATLVQTGYGERNGQDPRTLDLGQPMGVLPAGGCKQALVAAFLAKHFGGVVGVPAKTPFPTTTERGTQTQLVAANLIRFNHDDASVSVEGPLPAQTMSNHMGLVYSFLVKYFGTSIGQAVDVPLGTATEKDRFGLVLVWIAGEPWVITDIGMRMLTPRELARGQGFPDSYILTGSKTNQVARIGNSVSPQSAMAIARANYL